MIKKILPIMLMVLLLISLFSACTGVKDEQPQNGERTYSDFAGKKIGAQTGEIYTIVAKDLLGAESVPEYISMADLLESLRAGRIDAGLTDSSYIQPLIDSGAYPEFEYIWIQKDIYANESAVVFHTKELRDRWNDWFAGIVSDGTMEEIEQRWLGVSLPNDEDVPKFESSGENGVLRMCDTGNFPPYTYFDADGNPTGMDYELASRFAQYMGMEIELTTMNFDAIGPYVLTGKADMSACYLTVTEERRQSMIFGDPVTSTQGVLIVPKQGGDTSASNIAQDYTSFAGKNIAVITGVLTYNTTEKIGGKPVEYNDSASAAEDVRQGRVAGYMHALTAVQVMAAQMDGFDVIPVPKDIFAAQVAGISHDQAVIDRFNTFLSAAAADGTLSDMQNRWFGDGLDLDAPIPKIPNTGSNGVLKAAICSDAIPYVYVGANGQYSGFSVELALRFGAYEGKTVEFTDMEFGGLIPYIVSKKADIGLANIAITEERKQSVLFTDPFFDEQHGILALKQGGGASVSNAGMLSYTDFAGKTIGMRTGAVWDDTIGQLQGTPAYFSEMSAGVEDVRKGRIAGYITDLSATRVFVQTEQGRDFISIEVPAEIFQAPMGAISTNQSMIDKLNEFLAEIKANGIHDDMRQRWLKNIPDLDAPMPDIDLSGGSGTLVVASTSGALPFSYKGNNGEFKGFSIEIALRFAEYAGYAEIRFEDMEFAALIPYVVSGKADFAIADISITEERKKSVLFTDSIYDDQGGIIALRQSGNAGENTAGTLDYTDFYGKTLGIPNGYVLDTMIQDDFEGKVAFYSETSAGIEDVRQGRIAGFMTDYSISRVIINQPGNSDLATVPVPETLFSGPLGAVSVNQDIINRFNNFLTGLEADGTLQEMRRYWIEDNPGSDPSMPDIPLKGENGVLKVAIGSGSVPFCYIGKDGEIKGYCAELILRFAAHEGLDAQFTTMEFSALLPYITSGKADIGIDSITITEERKKSVLFTEPFYFDLIGIITLKPSNAASVVTRSYEDFEGKRLGVITGAVHDEVTKNELKATPVYYSENSAVIEDVRNGRLDGFTTDMSSGRIITMTPGNEDLECIEIPAEYYLATSGIFSLNQGLIDRFNVFLEGIKADGTLEEMHNRWLLTLPDLDAPMPDIPTTGENGTLTAATYAGDIPFTYAGANGELKGYSIEIAQRFAAHEGMNIEFTGMEFGAMIPYVVSGKADLGVANTFITEERKQSVLFTESVFNDTLCIITLRQNGITEQTPDGGGFIKWMKTGIERNLITDNRWKMIVNGLSVTMIISFAAQIFGTVFGCFICWLLTRRNKLVKWIGNFYCGLIHGTPIVVLLMITYYIIFGNTSVSNVLVAIASFTMIMGAGIAVNLKGAIDTIDPVEIEAARSIGFSAFQAFITVTLPQAIKRALPGYTNGFVELVKATAIVGYIAIQDLTRAGDIIRSRTYDAYFPLLFVAVIYLTVTTVCVQLFKIIINKINGESDNSCRRKRLIGTTALDYHMQRTKTGGDLINANMSEVKKGDSQ